MSENENPFVELSDTTDNSDAPTIRLYEVAGDDLEFRTAKDIRKRRWEISAFWQVPGNRHLDLRIEPVRFYHTSDVGDEVVRPPCFSMTFEAMEKLMTDAWRDGCRPEGWQEAAPDPAIGELSDRVAHLAAENERLRAELAHARILLHGEGMRVDKLIDMLGGGMSARKLRLKGRQDGTQEENT